MRALLLLAVVLAPAALVVAARRGPAQAPPTSSGLRAVATSTRRWRAGAVALGLVVAGVSLQWGALGQGVLLAAPLFALCVLTGVIVGELRVPAPAGPVRRAEVEVRRVRAYLPRRTACVVAAATGVLAALLVLTTALGGPDDLGRAGRSLTRQCSAFAAEGAGPWPGSFYAAPLAAVVAGGLLAAAVALRLVVRRPRHGDDRAVDERLRHQAAEAVTAASGLLVAVPLAGVSTFAASALLHISCRPAWWSALAWCLVLLVPALIALVAWCGVVLLVPRDAGEWAPPALVRRP